MVKLRDNQCLQASDPDPLVIDLIIGVAATGVASLLAKLVRIAMTSRQRKLPTALEPITFKRLRDAINELEVLTNQAFRLIDPSTRRQLGGLLLLNPKELEKYNQIRDNHFSHIRETDILTQELVRDLPSNYVPKNPRFHFQRMFAAQSSLSKIA